MIPVYIGCGASRALRGTTLRLMAPRSNLGLLEGAGLDRKWRRLFKGGWPCAVMPELHLGLCLATSTGGAIVGGSLSRVGLLLCRRLVNAPGVRLSVAARAMLLTGSGIPRASPLLG